MSLEGKWQPLVIKFLQDRYKEDIYIVKTTIVGGSKIGTPDILICYKGKFIALELKVNAELEKHQEITLNNILKAQGKAMEFRKSEDWKERVIQFIENNV